MALSSDLLNTSSLIVVDEPETLSSSASSACLKEKTKSNAGSDIPPEILFAILPRAIPPFALLDTMLSGGDNSPWCQTLQLMRSIVLVSRSWYDVGITFLYENICIRRYHQLESLLQTLTNPSAKHLSLLVKSLTIHCYIPIDKTLNFRASLQDLMHRCTSSSTFTYNGAYGQTMLAHFPPHITHLRLEGSFEFHGLFASCLSQLRKTLLSFHLTVSESNFGSSWRSAHMPIESRILILSSLQSLSLSVRPIDALNIFREYWTMPSLQRLIVSRVRPFNLCDLDEQMAVVDFLERHGRQVRQVGVKGFQFNPEMFKRLLACCPRLERLLLHPSTFLRKRWADSHDFCHPNLRWIDFVYNLWLLDDYGSDDYGSSELHLSKKNFPALEGVRRFHNFPDDLQKWVDDCPPSTYAEMEEFVIEVFQHRVGYRDGSFFWRFERDVWEDDDMREGRLSGSFTVWEYSDFDSDNDYVFTSSDEPDDLSEESEFEWTNEDEEMKDLDNQ